jgi:hypothetical protein
MGTAFFAYACRKWHLILSPFMLLHSLYDGNNSWQERSCFFCFSLLSKRRRTVLSRVAGNDVILIYIFGDFHLFIKIFLIVCTQLQWILSYSSAMYEFLKTLHPGGIRTRDLLFCRWTRWPLYHAARACDFHLFWAWKCASFLENQRYDVLFCRSRMWVQIDKSLQTCIQC